MRPIWHFSLHAFKSYEQNKVDCPKNGKIQWPVPQRGKKVKYFKRRHKNYFGVGWDRLNICLTIRNHWKSGSIPTSKHTVEILHACNWLSISEIVIASPKDHRLKKWSEWTQPRAWSIPAKLDTAKQTLSFSHQSVRFDSWCCNIDDQRRRARDVRDVSWRP